MKRNDFNGFVFCTKKRLGFALAALLLMSACSEDRVADLAGNRMARLTGQASNVLGFENEADWSVINKTNALHTQGAVSGEVNVTGWMQITSVNMSSITVVGETIGTKAFIDVRVPQQVYWGEVRLIIEIPSKGIYWRELG